MQSGPLQTYLSWRQREAHLKIQLENFTTSGEPRLKPAKWFEAKKNFWETLIASNLWQVCKDLIHREL